MLTVLLVVATVIMILQRSEVFDRYLGDGSDAFELVRDEIILPANELAEIDVLANDVGIGSSDRNQLIVVTQPPCGRASAVDGRIQFVATERCAGPQSFNYAVSGRGEGVTGEVLAIVRVDDPAQNQIAADAQRDVPAPTPAPAPAVAQSTLQRSAADPSVLAAQPEGATRIAAVPSVPRPQTGQVNGLVDIAVAARAVAAGNAGLALGVGGSVGPSPSVTIPSDQYGGGEALAAQPPIQPPMSPEPAPEPALEPAPAPETAQEPDQQTIAALQPAAGEPPQQAAEPAEATGSEAGPEDAGINREAPAEISHSETPALPSDEPVAALGSLFDQGGLVPVITTPPAELADPLSVNPGAAQQQAEEQQPDERQLLASTQPQAELEPQPQGRPQTVPAAQQPAAQCDTPAVLTVDVRLGALTGVSVQSPCDALDVAVVRYDDLEFAFALDAAGAGSILVPGFQPATSAELWLPSGNGSVFDLAFEGTENMERVGVVWDAPVQLDLHAFEFGADIGSAGHVRPDRPGSFELVQWKGGGYLSTWRSVQGRGQNVSVYTYWRRPGGRSGIVDLSLDFASRQAEGAPETCGGGALAQPDFKVIRMLGGRSQRPERRRIAALDCTAVAGSDRFIRDALDDIVVRRK